MKKQSISFLKRHHLFIFLLICISYYSKAQDNTINVMPLPKNIVMGNGKIRISNQLKINLLGDRNDTTLEDAANRMLRKINLITLAYFEQEYVKLNEEHNDAIINIKVEEKKDNSIEVDESYILSINEGKISLKAPNTIGALRGMETILQLVAADTDGYYFPEVIIIDKPRFKWRGMMVDVARHFVPIEILKRNIDAMGMVKMNVLHLHLSDDEGFRVESKLYPKLHERGSNQQYYTQEELRNLVKYADERGIIIYPEFDLPGHSKSWFAGYPELASSPGEYKPGPRYEINPNASLQERNTAIFESPTPTINPAKDEVYNFLDGFIGEMADIFPCPYYHIGADENNGKAWETNPQIVQFMKDNNLENVHELQKYFVKKIYNILKKHNRTMIGWEEAFDENLPKGAMFQTWGGSGTFGGERITLDRIIENGSPALISTGFYLDLFLPAYIHYNNPNIPSDDNPNILGGEAALWSELVDEFTFEGRAWPRTAAIAERLWSPSEINNIDEMYRRLFILDDKFQIAGLNQNYNSQRMLSSLCNTQDINHPLNIIQILAPKKGYIRLGFKMKSLPRTKYQSVPLVDLADMVPCDSKVVWNFRKQVETYLESKEQAERTKTIGELKKIKESTVQTKILTKSAPNLSSLGSYADKIGLCVDIGIKALSEHLSEDQKAIMVQQLNSLLSRADELEIAILPEINALITGKLIPLPSTYPAY